MYVELPHLQPRPALPPRPPFDTATMRRKTKNESEQQRSRAVAVAAAATHPTGSTAEVAVEALPIRANPGMKKRDSFEVRLPNL